MVNFVEWLYSSFRELISYMSGYSVQFVSNSISEWGENYSHLPSIDINLYLFSENPIISTNAFDGLLLFFSIFYTVIFIVIVYKIIKKVFVKITRWNKW